MQTQLTILVAHVVEKNCRFLWKSRFLCIFKYFTQKFKVIMSTFNHHFQENTLWPPKNTPKWGEKPGKILLAKILGWQVWWVHCVLPPCSSVIECDILKQSWRKCSPELKINHYIVPFRRTDESFKQWRRWDCAGNCFSYDNDKPRPAVHKEKLGHTLLLNMMRC
jgi:hypothetical protein